MGKVFRLVNFVQYGIVYLVANDLSSKACITMGKQGLILVKSNV